MEDDNKSTRLISSRVLTRLLENMSACQQIDYDTLHKIYPHLLKRLDDACDDIRIVVATTFLAYFDAFSDDYDANFYKAHLEVMYQGLLLHLDDSEKSIQDAILSKFILSISFVKMLGVHCGKILPWVEDRGKPLFKVIQKRNGRDKLLMSLVKMLGVHGVHICMYAHIIHHSMMLSTILC